MTVLVATWHPVEAATSTAFTAHLRGRELSIAQDPEHGCWRWRVVSQHGGLLAEGTAPDRLGAERAAEDEATAVHPPTDAMLDRLLT